MKYSIESLRLQVAKENEKLRKDLTEVKKKYPLVYHAYLVNAATIAQLASDAFVGGQALYGSEVAKNEMAVHFRKCREDFRRAQARATNDEETVSAIETFLKCIFHSR